MVKNITKSVKYRYFFLIIAKTLVIITAMIYLQQKIELQKSNATLIEITRSQSLLSHEIIHTISLTNDVKAESENINLLEDLNELLLTFENSQKEHRYFNENFTSSETIDSLFNATNPYVKKIRTIGEQVLLNDDPEILERAIQDANTLEKPYNNLLNSLSKQYLIRANDNLNALKRIVYLLAVVIFLIILGLFFLGFLADLKRFFKKNRELLKTNKVLLMTENKLEMSLLEQEKLKIDLGAKDEYNKIFIEQAPTAIAMVDTNMCYIAVSKRWITDYKMEGQEFIGRSHYELFPEIGEDWKAMHQRCLKGEVDIREEEPFVRLDGSVQWIFWEVRPWYASKGVVGGILMYTGDITLVKEKEEENLRIQKILNKTNEIARIGAWEYNMIEDEFFWSKIICEIHEVPENFKPNLKTALSFVKEGPCLTLLNQEFDKAIETGGSFDVEVQLITANNNVVWTRIMGQAEITDGQCVRVYGVHQDINKVKLAKLALSKANSELQGLLNSGPLAILSLDNYGLINHFNKGAERMLGYKAEEVVGLKTPISFHPKEEFENFIADTATSYGFKGDLKNFNLFSESLDKNLNDTREWTFIRKDGSKLPVLLTISSFKNEEGENHGFLGVAVDLSEKRITEDLLLQKNQLLNLAEEITTTGHWKWGVKENKVEWSDALYNIFERDKTLNDITYETYFEYVHDDDKELVGKNVMSAVNGGDFESISYRVNVNGKIKIIQLLGQSVKNDKGEVIELIGTCRDITHQLIAENKFRGLLESAPDAMIIVDEDGLVQIANKQAENLFGYTASELIGGSAAVLFPERIAAYFHKYQSNYFGNPTIASIGVHKDSFIVTKEGKEIQVQLSLSPFEGDDGVLVSTAIRDVTIQKTVEKELLRRNQLLTFAEKITKMGNWQWDLKANILHWSPSLCKIFEVEEGFIMTFEKYFEFVHPDDKSFVNETVKESINGKQFNSVVHRIVLKSGIIKTIQLLAVATTNLEGDVLELIGSCQDITVIKAAERDLFDANTQLKALFNSGRIAIISVNNNGIINHFNRGAELLLGYSASEMIDLQKPNVYHIKDEMLAFKKDVAKKYNKENFPDFNPFTELSNNDDYDTREWTFIRKDGIPFPVELTLTAIKNKEGEKIGFLAVANNISERKRATDELLRKNQILSFAEEITLMGNWQADIINNITKWSANLYAIFELDENTITTLDTYLEYTHPEDRERVAKHMQDSVKNKTFSHLLHRIQLDSGKVKNVQLLGQVLTDNMGTVTEIIGTCQDVTEQKKAENDLIRKNHMLSFAEEITLMGNWQVDVVNNKVKWSKNLYEIFDLKKSTIMSQRTYLDLVFKDDKEKVFKHIKETIKNKTLTSLVHRIELPNGSMKTLQILGQVFTNDKGEVIEVIGTCQDITLQKIGEEELLRKNQLLTFAEEITMMGNWQWDLITDDILWSSNMYKLFGLDKESPMNFDVYFNLIHPDDKEGVKLNLEKAFADDKFEDIIHRVVLKDGTVKIIHIMADIIYNDVGVPVEMIGACQDVTEQKMAENKFRGLLESAPDAMVIVNEKGKIQLINKQAENLFGYSLNELFNKSVEILIPERFNSRMTHKENRNNFFSNPKVMQMGLVGEKEIFGINKEGKEIPIQISLSPLQTEEGLLVSAAIRDVTVQKLAARRILEAKEKLEVLTEHLSEQNKQLEDFAHISSHNLRSPVSNLNSLLYLYNESDNDEEREELFEKFETTIGHLTSTLNTLISALKTRSGGVKELEILSFKNVWKKTEEMISEKISETNATIISDFSKTPTIEYHKAYLESIFINLLTNALRYRSPKRAPEINVYTELVNGKIKMTIEDNGLGIDLARHGHKLFGLYKTFHRHADAKGVGLYLTKIQVETMGGIIYAESEVDKGTVFTIIFNILDR